MSTGRVYLVGAGPGDPGLLTVRARELLEAADVVVHDRLGTEAVLPLCRPDAELVNAGKAPGRAALTQGEINDALVAAAGRAGTVVRLKGGDPFLFGRGGEEAEALTAAGVPYEVVPGVTSAIAAPAYAGVPVTHRGAATAVTIVTGHEDPGKAESQTDWAAIARVGGTIVLLMGMARLEAIASALIAAGRPADEPAAVVQWGTTPRQRSLVATLGTVAEAAALAGLGAPAVVVVGPVAALGERIAWLDGPLRGRRIVVTRARAQASELTTALRALGAEVIELPTIRIVPVASSAEIDAACARIGDYDLLVLTSVNGVDTLLDRLWERGRDARALASDATLVAIGPATAERLAARGMRVDVVPERFLAEGVLEALEDRSLDGARVLVARAREARPELVDGLRARGAQVDEVALYDTIAEAPPAERLADALDADYLTFTASSTVRRFAELVPPGRLGGLPGRVVSIGPITSQTAREHGLVVHAEAAEHSIPGLVEALLEDAAARV